MFAVWELGLPIKLQPLKIKYFPITDSFLVFTLCHYAVASKTTAVISTLYTCVWYTTVLTIANYIVLKTIKLKASEPEWSDQEDSYKKYAKKISYPDNIQKM